MIKIKADLTGLSKNVAKFRKHPELLHRETVSLLKQEGRELCKELCFNTLPFGFGDNSRQKFANRIDAEIRRLFPSKEYGPETAFLVYEVLQKTDLKLAAAFWSAHKARDTTRAQKILNRRGSAGGVNESAYQSARANRGRVKRNADALAIAPASRVNALIKRQQKNIGMAKAAWYLAAKGIGGRLRSTGSGGKIKATYPKWVIATSRMGNFGGAYFRDNAIRPDITVFSRVRHGSRALPAHLYNRAIDRSEDALKKALLISIAKLNKKQFKRAA